MKRSDRPPDYLIDQIARHADVLVKMQQTNTREANALRLLKLEVKKLLTYKQNKDGQTSKKELRQEGEDALGLCEERKPKADNGLHLF